MGKSNIVSSLFKVIDAKGKIMKNFPIQSRPKGKSNSPDKYTNDDGVVEVLSSPNRDIEVLVLNTKDQFILKVSVNSGNGSNSPQIIKLDEAYEDFSSITIIKVLDRKAEHYVVADTNVEMIFDGNNKMILPVKEGKFRLKSWVGQQIKLTIYKPDGKPLDTVTYIARRVQTQYVDLQLDVDVTNGKTNTNDPKIPKRVEDTANFNVGWNEDDLGKLSEQYESGGRGSIAVSVGVGDSGGVSYGKYQMTSQTQIKNGKTGKVSTIIGGRVKEFVNSSEFPWKNEFIGLTPGTNAFSLKWKEVVRREGEKFSKKEHQFIKKTHYDVTINNTIESLKIDLRTHSHALNDVVWSTSVQQGPKNEIINKVIKKLGDTPANTKDYDKKLIEAIYNERGRRNIEGKLVYFRKNSKKVQDGVAARFVSEKAKALKELENEK